MKLTKRFGYSVCSKPKNARAKRALAAREPQLVENEKTAIFVRGEKVSESVRDAMKDLVSPSHIKSGAGFLV